jgi:hypothetical protein
MGKRPRGPMPGWQPRTPKAIAVLADLVAVYDQHHAQGTLPRGPRGAFYDCRPTGHGNGITYTKPTAARPASRFDPMEASPEYVQQEILAPARRALIIPEHWVADGRALSPNLPDFDGSAEDCAAAVGRLVHDAADGFDLDRQGGQPVHIEVLCEAADLVERLARIALPYGVGVYPGSGYDGLKQKRAMGERALERDVPTVVLHVGDRDDHGERIYLAAGEDAVGWAGDGEVCPVEQESTPASLADLRDRWLDIPAVLFVRLALSTAQALTLNLLDADGKAEADAIPVPVMDQLLRDAIEVLQVPARRDEVEDAVEDGRRRLPALIRAELAEAS